MNKLFEQYIKTDMLPTLFCPGCGNGIVQMAAIEAIDKLGLQDDLACVSGIGCSSWIPCYLELDVMHTMHGRALAFAQGLKLARPDKKVMVFTGDGDCLAIGGNHFLHAARRNMDMTVILVNNYIYGMTGGQKSPSTPEGAITKTSPFGAMDTPLDGCELAIAAGATYVAQWTTAHPVQLERAIEEGLKHNGFAFIEVLCQCPVQAGKKVYGVKEPAEIMAMYKESTYFQREGMEPQPGKTRIGLLKQDKEAAEYTDRVAAMMEAQGYRRG